MLCGSSSSGLQRHATAAPFYRAGAEAVVEVKSVVMEKQRMHVRKRLDGVEHIVCCHMPFVLRQRLLIKDSSYESTWSRARECAACHALMDMCDAKLAQDSTSPIANAAALR